MALRCLLGHIWDGCTCSICGKVRDVDHHWDGCKCSKCGKIRNTEHTIQYGFLKDHDENDNSSALWFTLCTRCGSKIYEPQLPEYIEPSSPQEIDDFLQDYFGQELLTDITTEKNFTCKETMDFIVDISKNPYKYKRVTKKQIVYRNTDSKTGHVVIVFRMINKLFQIVRVPYLEDIS